MAWQGRGIDPRTIGALHATKGLNKLPETHTLDAFQGKQLDAQQALRLGLGLELGLGLGLGLGFLPHDGLSLPPAMIVHRHSPLC